MSGIRNKATPFLIAFLLMNSFANVSAEEEAVASGTKLETKTELGFLATSGNTQLSSWTAELESVWTQNSWKYTGAAFYLRSSENGELNAQEQRYRLRAARSFSERWSAYGQTSFSKNEFKGIDSSLLFDVGLDFQVLKKDEIEWVAEASVGYLVEERIPEESIRDLSLGLGHEIKYKISKDLSLKHALSASLRVQEPEDWRALASLGLETPVHPQVKMGASMELENFNLPPAGKKKTDYRTQLSFVAEF